MAFRPWRVFSQCFVNFHLTVEQARRKASMALPIRFTAHDDALVFEKEADGLTELILQRRFSVEEIRAIMGENIIRFLSSYLSEK